jgi:hypothetical protein
LEAPETDRNAASTSTNVFVSIFVHFLSFPGFPYFFASLPSFLTSKEEIVHFIHKLGSSLDQGLKLGKD